MLTKTYFRPCIRSRLRCISCRWPGWCLGQADRPDTRPPAHQYNTVITVQYIILTLCNNFKFCQNLGSDQLGVLKKSRSNSSYFSKSTEAKQLARQRIEQNLPPKHPRHLCLCFSLHPSSSMI